MTCSIGVVKFGMRSEGCEDWAVDGRPTT
jgi:hypothetical protein